MSVDSRRLIGHVTPLCVTDCKVGAPKLKRPGPRKGGPQSGPPFGRCSISYLEIQPQCDLNLPVGSYAHSVRHGLVKPAEDSPLPAELEVCRSRHGTAATIVRVDGGWGILEIWMVEDIIELRTNSNSWIPALRGISSDRVTSACTSFDMQAHLAAGCRTCLGRRRESGWIKNPLAENGFTPE